MVSLQKVTSYNFYRLYNVQCRKTKDSQRYILLRLFITHQITLYDTFYHPLPMALPTLHHLASAQWGWKQPIYNSVSYMFLSKYTTCAGILSYHPFWTWSFIYSLTCIWGGRTFRFFVFFENGKISEQKASKFSYLDTPKVSKSFCRPKVSKKPVTAGIIQPPNIS